MTEQEQFEESVEGKLVRLRLITSNLRLKNARKERGWTQPELAVKIGMASSRLLQIENLHRLPTEDDMIKLSIALETPIDYLFPEGLLFAIKAKVFSRRVADLEEPQVISLAEVARVRLLPPVFQEEEIVKGLDRELLQQRLTKILLTLKPREREVIKYRFGLFGGNSHTLEEVGQKFGVIRERIRQIETKALRELRHPMRSSQLLEFIND